MSHPDTEYEYTLSTMRTSVLVRRIGESKWNLYYLADSPADAERILQLLFTPQGEEMARR